MNITYMLCRFCRELFVAGWVYLLVCNLQGRWLSWRWNNSKMHPGNSSHVLEQWRLQQGWERWTQEVQTRVWLDGWCGCWRRCMCVLADRRETSGAWRLESWPSPQQPWTWSGSRESPATRTQCRRSSRLPTEASRDHILEEATVKRIGCHEIMMIGTRGFNLLLHIFSIKQVYRTEEFKQYTTMLNAIFLVSLVSDISNKYIVFSDYRLNILSHAWNLGLGQTRLLTQGK